MSSETMCWHSLERASAEDFILSTKIALTLSLARLKYLAFFLHDGAERDVTAIYPRIPSLVSYC